MNNKVIYINKEKLNKLYYKTQTNILKVVIDGAKINTWKDYWNAVSQLFSFPDLPSYMKSDYHSYYDLMTDLSWLKNENIILIVENADSFLANDLQLKNNIIKDFNEYLLPFWDEEVSKTVINGKKKNFSVYFVEE